MEKMLTDEEWNRHIGLLADPETLTGPSIDALASDRRAHRAEVEALRAACREAAARLEWMCNYHEEKAACVDSDERALVARLRALSPAAEDAGKGAG